MKKQRLQEMKKEIQFESQILTFLDLRFTSDVYYKDTNTHDYLPYDSAHPESCKKSVPYNLAKRIIVFVTDSEKVKLTLNELRTWVKIYFYR